MIIIIFFCEARIFVEAKIEFEIWKWKNQNRSLEKKNKNFSVRFFLNTTTVFNCLNENGSVQCATPNMYQYSELINAKMAFISRTIAREMPRRVWWVDGACQRDDGGYDENGGGGLRVGIRGRWRGRHITPSAEWLIFDDVLDDVITNHHDQQPQLQPSPHPRERTHSKVDHSSPTQPPR